MLMIRLQRIGRKKKPSYRLVLAEKTKDTQGHATEVLGTYNPILKEKTISIKKDRVEYWLSKGAQASPTVHNLLLKEGIVTGGKKKSVSISQKRQAKINEKSAAKAEAEEKAKAEAEAKAKAEAEAKKQAEAAAEATEETKDAEPEATAAPDTAEKTEA